MSQPTAGPQGAAPQGPAPQQQSASGKAIAALVCGIIGLVTCIWPLDIVAIILGKIELGAITRGESPEAGRSMAKIGRILGIIGLVIAAVAIIFYVIAVLAAIGSMPQDPSY